MNVLCNKQKPGKEERQKQRCPLLKAMRANQPLHRIAARLRFLPKLKGHGWAANGDWER
jgi:hypothetical protein